MRRIFYPVFLIVISGILSSCATVKVKPLAQPSAGIYPQQGAGVLRSDVFHVVGPGETLWRISKMYDVPIQNILQANSLKNKEALKKGQRLLVPAAAPVAPVVVLYPSSKWKYIVVHHSGTDEGSSLDFDKYHSSKGWAGVGYHFIIANGTKTKQDGQIEVSPRWIKQQSGAHCQAGGMNCKGIGICLVGNFNQERVSQKQLDALIYLVNTLRRYYKIPGKNIIGHRQARGAKTDCPGKYFPWKEFKKRLN